jgi:hypothetical protein
MKDTSIFYQLPQISSQPTGIKWITSPKLQKYIEKLANPHVDQIAYHLVTTSPNPITTTCLTAFLAHITLLPIHRLKSTHSLLQQHYTEDLADLIQIGLEIISQPHNFLTNFDPTKSLANGYWYPTIYKWSQQKFDRLLIDKIRNQKGMSSFKRSNLSLVSRATPTKITKALNHQGYPPATHSTYLALHFCLTTAVKANRFSTAQPQAADYAEILALYRQRPVNTLDRTQVISHLEQLGQAVRNYEQLRLQSIDLPLGNDSEQTLIDIIPDTQTPLDTAILNEYQQQVNQLKNIVIGNLQKLPIERDRLLFLLYGLELTQAETGLETDCHQATVKKTRDRILAFVSQETYHQTCDKSPPLSSEKLQQLVTHLTALCKDYYPNLTGEIITQFINQDFAALVSYVNTRWQKTLIPTGHAITKLRQLHSPLNP